MKNLFIAMFISISLPHAVFAGTFETSQNSFYPINNCDANDPSGNTATVDLVRHQGGEL